MIVCRSWEPEGARESRAGLHLLLVAEDPATAASVSTQLELDGHWVEITSAEPEELKEALASQPDVALLGAGLARVDRWQVTTALLEQEQTTGKRPFVIATTSLVAQPGRQEGMEGIDLDLGATADLSLVRWVLRRFQSVIVPESCPREPLAAVGA